MQIASLEDTAAQMGQISKLVRLLATSGITSEHFQRAIDNKSARANLVEFLRAECPKVDYTQPVPKAKRAKKGASQTFDEVAYFQTLPGFLWVDLDLKHYVGLQVRPTRPHTALKCRPLLQGEREDVMFGKRDSLEHAQTLVRACELGQIAGKIEVQKNGEDGELLTDGRANIFPFRGLDGTLRVVSVYRGGGWWSVDCNPFRPARVCNGGDLAFSN